MKTKQSKQQQAPQALRPIARVVRGKASVNLPHEIPAHDFVVRFNTAAENTEAADRAKRDVVIEAALGLVEPRANVTADDKYLTKHQTEWLQAVKDDWHIADIEAGRATKKDQPKKGEKYDYKSPEHFNYFRTTTSRMSELSSVVKCAQAQSFVVTDKNGKATEHSAADWLRETKGYTHMIAAARIGFKAKYGEEQTKTKITEKTVKAFLTKCGDANVIESAALQALLTGACTLASKGLKGETAKYQRDFRGQAMELIDAWLSYMANEPEQRVRQRQEFKASGIPAVTRKSKAGKVEIVAGRKSSTLKRAA